MSFHILVDSREPKSIVRTLKGRGLNMEITKLDVGDYVVGKFLIERKESKDFLASIYDKRLFTQLKAMGNLDSDHKPLLMVYGKYPPSSRWIKTKAGSLKVPLSESEKEKRRITVIATLCATVSSFNVSVLYLPNQRDFIEFIVRLYHRQSEHESVKPVVKKESEDAGNELQISMESDESSN